MESANAMVFFIGVNSFHFACLLLTIITEIYFHCNTLFSLSGIYITGIHIVADIINGFHRVFLRHMIVQAIVACFSCRSCSFGAFAWVSISSSLSGPKNFCSRRKPTFCSFRMAFFLIRRLFSSRSLLFSCCSLSLSPDTLIRLSRALVNWLNRLLTRDFSFFSRNSGTGVYKDAGSECPFPQM